ncbi:hypothetical protein TD95_002246 [Thielaviopsis punctulata]|uniref:BZIP domain-containing protein n=1 Tax=Thielaviopsis punctulata TaxID=72032 RepID=A0A0F4ZD58_9PEZI|nr:hypothetical protein TD95_002246 [Thielaviopsis punctulata]
MGSRPNDPISIKQEEPGRSNRPINEALKNELNPFEKSFSSGAVGSGPIGNGTQTPSATKLPSVSALASPSANLGNRSPFGWNNSLKSGPLSPALLSGPIAGSGGDYFVDRGFNESSLRTGLTPVPGSSSIFPPSPSAGSLFASFPGGASTPTTADFHRTALSAATKQREQQQKLHMTVTSEPRDTNIPAIVKPNERAPETKASGNSNLNHDPHANDAVNGLFMLAQGRSVSQSQSLPPNSMSHPPAPASAARTAASALPLVHGTPLPNAPTTSVQSNRTVEPTPLPNSRPRSPDNKAAASAKGKRASTSSKSTISTKRKNDSPPAKTPKKAKGVNSNGSEEDDEAENEGDAGVEGADGEDDKKMTDSEKRKNFLERNRIAALKCRQRKKQWLNELQTRVDSLTTENEDLNSQINRLRTEMVNLKTLLLAHKDCPVTLEQVVRGQYPADNGDNFNAQMNPYPAGSVPPNVQGQPRRMTTGQPILNGQPAGRGF